MAGVEAAELLEFMLTTWRIEGPPVLLIEGFSGIGKSELAANLLKAWGQPTCTVSIPNGGCSLDSLLFDIAATLEVRGYSGVADADDGDFRLGMRQNFMTSEGLIVVDDFDEAFSDSGCDTLPQIVEFLNELGRIKAPGRLLLVSSVSPNYDNWAPSVTIKTMAPPSALVAEGLLIRLLDDRGIRSEIPRRILPDVVRWLGNNPRAMRALVACLLENPLDELIQLDDDAWERRDDSPSPALISRLETLFLKKTLGGLPAHASLLLEGLSVFRKPFTIDAMHAQAIYGVNALLAKDDLQRRFLLGRDRKWYTLNPVARQLANARLRTDPRAERRSHSSAADFFRKRASPTRTRTAVATGSDFIEAKYHLHKSGRQSEYQDLAATHRDLLLKNYRHIREAPSDPAERNFLLLTLGSILEENDWRGYARLRSLLARLLMERDQGRDMQRALRQITIACRESRDVADWKLRADLVSRLETNVALTSMGKEAIQALSWSNALMVALKIADLLAARGAERQSYDFLVKHMNDFPVAERQPLYTSAGYALVRCHQKEAAIDLLVAAYGEIGKTARNRHRLFEEALFLAFQARDSGRVKQIKAMVARDGRNGLQSDLCDSLLAQLEGSYDLACIPSAPRGEYYSLDCQVSFSYLCTGNIALAKQTLDEGAKTVNNATLWLEGLIAHCMGANELYAKAMGDLAHRLGDFDYSATDASWIHLWDRDPATLDPFPAFYFPILPSALTGLSYDLIHEHGSNCTADLSATDLHLPIGNTQSAASAGSPPSSGPIVINYTEGTSMGDTYNVGQAGAVGRKASATGNTFIHGGEAVDAASLLEQLKLLSSRLKSADVADLDVVEADVVVIDEATSALEAGDSSRGVGKLAKLGLSTLQFARDIGVDIAASVIRRSMGLS